MDLDNVPVSLESAADSDVGNTELFNHLRQMAADRFSSATDPFVADEVLKSCLIKPAPAELLAKLDPLVKVLERNLAWDRNDAPEEIMEAWAMLSLALAEYRKGNNPLAEKWARRCLRHANRNPSREAAALTVLAMATHRAGREREARDLLETARAAVTSHFEKPFQPGSWRTTCSHADSRRGWRIPEISWRHLTGQYAGQQ